MDTGLEMALAHVKRAMSKLAQATVANVVMMV